MMIAPDQDPRRQAITKEFFRVITESSDEYELFLSPVTIEELDDAKMEKHRTSNAEFLETARYIKLSQNVEAENLARIYATDGVLSQANIDDLRHVAYAVVSRCDYVVNWNMRHLVNDRTEMRVNSVNAKEKFANIVIVTPAHFTKGVFYAE
jgi:predicted nucleic acid-binding protein